MDFIKKGSSCCLLKTALVYLCGPGVITNATSTCSQACPSLDKFHGHLELITEWIFKRNTFLYCSRKCKCLGLKTCYMILHKLLPLWASVFMLWTGKSKYSLQGLCEDPKRQALQKCSVECKAIPVVGNHYRSNLAFHKLRARKHQETTRAADLGKYDFIRIVESVFRVEQGQNCSHLTSRSPIWPEPNEHPAHTHTHAQCIEGCACYLFYTVYNTFIPEREL